MARLPRKFLKVFAQDADNNGVFGSAADNTKIISSDPEVIQSKPAWLTGWLQAVIGTRKFPTLEEFQSCNFVNTFHLSYLYQQGIPEYNILTTYYQNSIVKRTGTYEIYGSLTDENTGNPLSDTDNWVFLQDLSLTTVPDATTVLKGIAMLATVQDFVDKNNNKISTPSLVTQYGFETGDWKGRTLSSLPVGWIWAAGNIGNSSSGANNRANADCENLFKAYWNDPAYNYTGSTATGAALQVFTSAGVAVAKGSTADEDWLANRRINVPDFRDRVPAGRGNMIGNAGRLSGQEYGVNGNGLGNAGGRESHSLVENENAPHRHTVRRRSDIRAPQQQPSAFIIDDVNAGYSPSYAGVEVMNLSGEGLPHNNVQPTIICNYVIKL